MWKKKTGVIFIERDAYCLPVLPLAWKKLTQRKHFFYGFATYSIPASFSSRLIFYVGKFQVLLSLFCFCLFLLLSLVAAQPLLFWCAAWACCWSTEEQQLAVQGQTKAHCSLSVLLLLLLMGCSTFTLLIWYIMVFVSCSGLGSIWWIVTCRRLAKYKDKMLIFEIGCYFSSRLSSLCCMLIWPHLLLPRRHLHNRSLRSHCHLSSGILWYEKTKRKMGKQKRGKEGWMKRAGRRQTDEGEEGKVKLHSHIHSLTQLFVLSPPWSDAIFYWLNWRF